VLSAARAIAQLTRLDAALIIYIALFLPLMHAGHDILYAFTRALPIAVISMCGFIINNLYDLEKDRQNHPERALPRGDISPIAAGIIYFALLAISLVLVRMYADEANVFFYLLLLLSVVNYNIAIAYFPYTKNIYVAVAGVVSTFILLTLTGGLETHLFVVCAVFFYLLGKEMLMDILDAKADAMTLVKLIGLKRSENMAFGSKLIADALLLAQASGSVALALASCLAISDIVCLLLWKVRASKSVPLFLMKCQALISIYFLL
jgi:geranylgeranylglycerol-phosphate geranylgeranyltransferase